MLPSITAAEDWLKPSAVLEAFEARAFRMVVACAQNLSPFANPEEGTSAMELLFHMFLFSALVLIMRKINEGVGGCKAVFH